MSDETKKMGVLPLAMFAIGTTLASGIFSLPGDFAKAGAHTLATLIGWAVAGLGMFALTMCFYRLSVARKDLTSGIYAYAREGFGDYIGFNSAWGYWLSAIIAQIAFISLLFETIGYYAPIFGNGTNLFSCIVATGVIWAIAALILKGVSEAVALNTIIVIAKGIPILFVLVAIILSGSFEWDVFTSNFEGDGTMSLIEQVRGTVYITVWTFTGIEGAVVISGMGKTPKTGGQATIIAFSTLFILYFLISFLSMGVMPAEELAQLDNPSLGGILAAVVGPWGGVLVNIALIISVGGAMFSYTILCVESAYGPASYKAFPESLAKKNKHGAPTWSILWSTIIVQIFIVIIYFNDATFQMCYALSTSAIVIPFVFSAFYYFKIVAKNNELKLDIGSKWSAWIIAIIGSLYGLFMLYASGITYLLAVTILYAPGTIVYLYNRKKNGVKYFEGIKDKIICICLIALAVIAVIMLVNGELKLL